LTLKATKSTFGNESNNIFFQNFIAKKVKKKSFKKKEQKEKIRVYARWLIDSEFKPENISNVKKYEIWKFLMMWFQQEWYIKQFVNNKIKDQKAAQFFVLKLMYKSLINLNHGNLVKKHWKYQIIFK